MLFLYPGRIRTVRTVVENRHSVTTTIYQCVNRRRNSDVSRICYSTTYRLCDFSLSPSAVRIRNLS